MAEPGATPWTEAERRYAEAMRVEADWAPLHFDGWSHYEHARPLLRGETIEVIGRWPEQGYTLQYRPLLSELTQARQFPIDPFPEVTVLGRIDKTDLLKLRAVASKGLVDELSETASHVATTDWTIPIEPPARTGSTIPTHEEVPIDYIPAGGRWLEGGRLIHEDHPSAAYAVAGHWGLRLGRPVGLTPTGLLIFQPVELKDLRVTIEHPVSQPVGPKITEGRVGLFRCDGLGRWQQTATVTQPDELQLFARPLESAPSIGVPFLERGLRHG